MAEAQAQLLCGKDVAEGEDRPGTRVEGRPQGHHQSGLLETMGAEEFGPSPLNITHMSPSIIRGHPPQWLEVSAAAVDNISLTWSVQILALLICKVVGRVACTMA